MIRSFKPAHYELFHTITNHFDQIRTISNYFETFRPILNHFEPLRTSFELFRAVANHSEPFRAVSKIFEPVRTISNHPDFFVIRISNYESRLMITNHVRASQNDFCWLRIILNDSYRLRETLKTRNILWFKIRN